MSVEVTQTPEAPKRSALKKIGRFFLWLLAVVILFFGTLVALLFIYEDEVKAAIVTELNKHLRAEVKIDPKNIDLTIIKTFPDCSIEFKDLLMMEAVKTKQRDTLLFAGQLNLHFNIRDLWNKKYEIQKIKLRNASAKLVRFKNGKNNYTFWQEDEETQPANDSMNFSLDLIALENVKFSYKDKQALFKTEVEIKNLDFKGRFSQSDFTMETGGTLLIKNITQNKTVFFRNKSFDLLLELNVHENDYVFKKASISLNELELDLEGNFRYKDSLENLDMSYNAPGLEISSALSLLPENYKDKINDYESSGNFYAKGNFKYRSRNSFALNTDFGIKDGRIVYKPKSTEATGVNLQGQLNYSNKSSELKLGNIYLRLNQDEIKGSCTIRNFSDPELQLFTEATIKLENIQNFWPIDTLTALKGSMTLNARVSGRVSDLKDRTFSKDVNLDLIADVKMLEVGFKNDDKVYAVESCSLIASDREIEVRDLKLKRGSSDLKLNGTVPGLFNYLVDKNEPLVIHGNLFSNYIKLEDFMSDAASSSTTNEEPLIPGNVEFKLNAAILKFGYAKFEAHSITGDIEIKDRKAIVSDMTFETMDGKANISAFADNSKNRLNVVLQSEVQNINVNQLFTQFNNFGQTTLEDKNIRGFATASIDFSGSWNNKLETDYKSIEANCKMNIDRGELIDFKPLLSLSKYVDVKELMRIKFSNLQSTINIKNEVISIPKTTVKNSVLNIDFFGTHSFNNEIDYHFQLLINEYLAKKRKSKEDEFGPVEVDNERKWGAYIRMKGNIDDPVMSYDKKQLKEKIRDDIKNEKQNVRQILKEEFGLFKKDSAVKKPDRQEPVFELEKPAKAKPKKETGTKNEKEEDEDF